MENVKGPISELKKYVDSKTRVKIYTRKEHGIRGYITGFIELFDKHWNITLTDCCEVWKRRKHRYSEAKVAHLGEPSDCSQQLANMGITVPETTVKVIDRKYVQCSRKVPQLMLRGEQIVLVTTDTEPVTLQFQTLKCTTD